MELRALRYFVTVAEELHFGRAAERLHIAQPAVSQQVARLERELGARLIDRSPRNVRLTDAGRRVLDAARTAIAAADRVHAAVREPAAGRVRIGTAPGMTGRLERAVDALRGTHATFEAVLSELPVDARLTALRRGDLDLALVRGPVTAPGLRVLPAWSEPLHAVVSVRHPAADRPAVTLGELSGHPLRMPSRDCDPPLYDAIATALARAGASPRLGRPAGTTPNTLVEIGTDPDSWALLPVGQLTGAGGARVRAIPLTPPISVTGNVLIPADTPPPQCVGSIVAAFHDTEPP